MTETTTALSSGKPYYRYYQQGEYDTWKIRRDENPNTPWQFAEEHDATRVSILCVSEDFDIAADKDAVTYSGNLFFDIDDPDLSVALKSANQLVAKLIALGTDPLDIECHLSGKKGVHVYLDKSLFCKEDGMPLLPEVYARLAMQLWVEGMDFAVYSAGKGRMVRPVNAQRPDGKFKVQVSTEELRGITLECYQAYVSVPRVVLPAGPKKWVPKLAKLFEVSKTAVNKPEVARRSVAPADLARLGASIPSCIEMLAEGHRKKVKGDGTTSFNSLAMQVGCWSKYSPVDNVVLQGLHERIARNNPSGSGESQHSRERKLQAMHSYLKQQNKYEFSCGAIKKLIEGSPECASCPVFEASQSGSGLLNAMCLTEHLGNYYSDKDKTVLVASFTMERDAIVVDENTKKVKSSTMLVRVPMTGETFKIYNFAEDAFISKQNLKKELSGMDGVSFFGSDNDVAKLRNTLTQNDLLNGAEIKQVYDARRIGIEYRRRSGPESPRDPGHRGRLIYIEPGFSINDMGVIGSHVITSDEPPAGSPNMKVLDWHSPISSKAEDALLLLTKVNHPHIIGASLGWFLASHLKSHFYALEHRFPILCMAGPSGTGKNSLVGVLMRICGVIGEKALMTLEVPQATHFPFQQALSDSSTIPRVLNEMNPKSVSKAQYARVIEMIKAAFDSQSIMRGRIGGGDRSSGLNVSTLSWKITAPVVVLSEEPIGVPAVKQRSVMLDMTLQGLDFGREAFTTLEGRADDLVDIGRILIREALNTNIRDLIEIYDNHKLPLSVEVADLPARVKYGYKVIDVAYIWAIQRLEAAGLSGACLTALRGLQAAFLTYIDNTSEQVSNDSQVTEVDLILRTLAIMAHGSSNTETRSLLVKGFHYVVYEGMLYLDILTIYPVLQAHAKSVGEILSIQSPEAFLKIVKSMPYYESDQAHTEFLPTHGRPVLGLDMWAMKAKGIPAAMFE